MDFISHKRAGRQIGSGVKRNVVVYVGRQWRESAGKIHHQAVATNSNAEYVQDMNTFSACSSLLYSTTKAACTGEGMPCTISNLTYSLHGAQSFLTFSRLMIYIYIYIYIYMSYRTANLQMLHFIYLFNKYTY